VEPWYSTYGLTGTMMLGVGRPIVRKQLQSVTARKPRMLGKIDLAHPPDPSRRMIVYPAKV